MKRCLGRLKKKTQQNLDMSIIYKENNFYTIFLYIFNIKRLFSLDFGTWCLKIYTFWC